MNCWYCGRSDSRADVKLRKVEIGEYKGEMVCEDLDDCASEAEGKSHDYPQDVEDTPCLEPAWWTYK